MAFTAQDALQGMVDLTLADTTGPGPYSLTASSPKAGRYSYPSQFIEAVDSVLGGATFCFAQVTTVTPQSISSITISGSTATLTTGSAHSLAIGHIVQFANVTTSAYNGKWVVATTPSTTTATLTPLAGEPAATTPPTTSATVGSGAYTVGIGAAQIVQFTHAIDSNGILQLQAQVWTGAANSGLSLGVAYAPAIMGGQWGWFQVAGAMVVYTAGSPAIGNQCYWNAGTANSVGGAITPSALASKQMQGVQYASAAGATYGSGSSAVTLPATKALIWGTFLLAQGAIT